MRISDSQIKQVNGRIDALIAADNFYGKKLKAAGITSVSTPEEFEALRADLTVLAGRTVYDSSLGESAGEGGRESATLWEGVGNSPGESPGLSGTKRAC